MDDENPTIEDVERAVADWEEAVTWIAHGWDCYEEYTNDLDSRDYLERQILIYGKSNLPPEILTRIEKADRDFRECTEDSDLCVWHVKAPFQVEGENVYFFFHNYDYNYEKERYWYYYRWLPDSEYSFRGHDWRSYHRLVYGMDFETMTGEELKSIALQHHKEWKEYLKKYGGIDIA